MRWVLFTILSLGLTSASLAEPSSPQCVPDPAQMPESWRAPAELQKSLNPAPWSEAEAKDAEAAVEAGVDEILAYYKRKPASVQNLWDDSIEPLVQLSHASANTPEFDDKLREAARNNMTALLKPYVERDPDWAICDEFDHMLSLSIFAHRLYPAKDKLIDVATKRLNAAYEACGSLESAMKTDLREVLSNVGTPPENVEDLFDAYLWSLWFIEAELYPDIELPDEAREFAKLAWTYLQSYRLAGASEFEKGARDENFIKIANLATRIAQIPSGAHRFPLYLEDKPDLYRFHRENFYPLMQTGDLSLFAAFVDNLRQYGCTPESDAQVRDGARYLLKAFHGNKNRWMSYLQTGELDDDVDDYGQVRLPWKAMLGLRNRKAEQPTDGTYGGIVRSWLPAPQ